MLEHGVSDFSHFFDYLVDRNALMWEALFGVSSEMIVAFPDDGKGTILERLAYLAVWDSLLANEIDDLPSDIYEQTECMTTTRLQQRPSLQQVFRDVQHARERLLESLQHVKSAFTSDGEGQRVWGLVHRSGELNTALYTLLAPLDLSTEPEFTANVREVVAYGLRSARQNFVRHLMRLPITNWLAKSSSSELSSERRSHTLDGEMSNAIDSARVQGVDSWTLKDLLGHMADWELFNAGAMEAFLEHGTFDWHPTRYGIDEQNDRNILIRRGQTWNEVLSDFHRAYQWNMRIAKSWSGEDLLRKDDQAPAGWRQIPYGWLTMTARHYREHLDYLSSLFQRDETVPQSASVLIVDSPAESYVSPLYESLSGQNLRVQLAPCLEMAMEFMASHRPGLIVLDLDLPDGDGVDLFESAMQRPEPVPVIATTRIGYDRRHWLLRARARGLRHSVYKPVRAEEMVSAVMAVMKQERTPVQGSYKSRV